MFVFDDFFKNFKVISLCGKGATSRVYKIQDTITGDLYALKEIKEADYTNEAINLTHPYIREYLRLETTKYLDILKSYKDTVNKNESTSELCYSDTNILSQSNLSNYNLEQKRALEQNTVAEHNKAAKHKSNICQPLTNTVDTKYLTKNNSPSIFNKNEQTNDTESDYKNVTKRRSVLKEKNKTTTNKMINKKIVTNNCRSKTDARIPFSHVNNNIEKANIKSCRLFLQSKTIINCCKTYYYTVANKYKEIVSFENLFRNTKLYKKLMYIRTLVNKLDLLHNKSNQRKKYMHKTKDNKHFTKDNKHYTIISSEINDVGVYNVTKKHKFVFYLSRYCKYTLRDLINIRNDQKNESCDENDISYLKTDTEKDTQTNINFDYKPLFYKIVQCVQYLHKKNMIHRDIKPENIFFTSAGNLNPKIGDFGSAKEVLIEDNATQMTNDIGTETYAAPELKDSKYDNRVDIYSLGIILYELTDTFTTEMERIEKISNLKNYSYTSQIGNETTADRIIKECIFKDYTKRPCATKLLRYLIDWV
ncbi:hypothetical protein BDAP_001937 [Binucleata daphniae]